MLWETVGAIHANPADFDLDQFSFGEFPGTAEMIEIQRYEADKVADLMNRILDALEEARAALQTSPSSNPTPRHDSIGIGANGTHPAAVALYDLTASCLASTAQEYALGRDLFNATIDDYFRGDQESKAKVDQLAASEALTDLMGGS